MAKFVLITQPPQLADLVSYLHTQPLVAVDTESDSLYSYFEKVCLLQITAGDTDYIVDPLSVDITPMESVFASDGIEKIFHAAEYDIMTLRRDYGFQFNHIFDTMIAARILGWPKYGLGHILQTVFQVKPDKKFQQYNWGQRPLSPQSLRYAQMDTHYLAPLRAIQFEELKAANRLEEAVAAFKRMTLAKTLPKTFDPLDFWRIKGARLLSPAQQSTLQALFVFRDEIARRLDRPPFKVLNDNVLYDLVVECPQTIIELKKSKGLSVSLLAQYGPQMLALLRASHPEGAPAHSQSRWSERELDEDESIRYEHLRNWRNHLAETRGVEPGVILSNNVLKAIAKANPHSITQLKEEAILGNWQYQTYAAALIDELKRCPV